METGRTDRRDEGRDPGKSQSIRKRVQIQMIIENFDDFYDHYQGSQHMSLFASQKITSFQKISVRKFFWHYSK